MILTFIQILKDKLRTPSAASNAKLRCVGWADRDEACSQDHISDKKRNISQRLLKFAKLHP